MLTALPTAAHAATFTVTNLNDSGPGSLRQAVSDANANPGADTIVFQSGLTGTITLTSGEIGITEEVTINGPGAGIITVSGNHTSRILNGSGVNLTLSGLALINGFGTDINAAFTAVNGGAISANAVTVTDCTFANNRATGAVAITPPGGHYPMPGLGGAIYAGTVIATRCLFSDNLAGGPTIGTPPPPPSVVLGGGGGEGGAIFAFSVTTTSCAFRGNNATSSFVSATITVVPAITVAPSGYGGAIYAGNIFSPGNATSTNDLFFGNSSRFGGGISVGATNGPPGTLTVTNDTFSGNSSAIDAFASVSVTNTILWANSPNPGQGPLLAATLAVISHSDVQGGLTPDTSIIDAGSNINADPLFVNAAAGDLHLTAGSPCIDAGDNSAPGLVGITTDLDGLPRFVGVAVDMGAYEFQAVPPSLVAVDDTATVAGFHLLTIPVLANDIVPAGSTITITAVSRASHGAVSIGPNGTVRYRPLPGFTGTDHFTYTITDDHGNTATATVTVTVT
jgi:hypothetical protein